MSDAVQMPPSMPVVPRVAPVRAAEHVEPPKKSQTENHNSSDHRQDKSDPARETSRAADRDLYITRDEATQGFVYRSVEADTGEIVWQWPTEQILRRAQYMRDVEEQAQHELDEKA